MTNSKDLILKLKDVREEKGFSLTDIAKIIEDNGEFVSKTTLSRVFAEGSEEIRFRYEDTLRPIANALLDIENIEDDDTIDARAMKSLLKYKIERISELEQQVSKLESELDKQKIKAHEKLDKERLEFGKSIEFLKEQVALKDKRMDMLLNAVVVKDQQYKEILDTILSCPARNTKVGCDEN